mgnify:CR=1 FL=1
MKQEIINIIREILYIKEGRINEKTILEEVIKDSMQVIELIAVLSNKYKLTIDPQEMGKIKTVGDLIDYVNKKKNSRKGGEPLDSF